LRFLGFNYLKICGTIKITNRSTEIRKHIRNLKLRLQIMAVEESVVTERRTKRVIRDAYFGTLASKADTERRSNARSKSERAVDPDERVP
jgi:hypothetical protein